MIRGLEGRDIFRNDEDRENFLSRLGQLVKKTGDRILAWSLLDNHVHLLLFSGPSGLSTLMRRLLTGYAGWFNRRHGRVGHLFQNRYKSIVCEEEAYLLELVRYIHLNPRRASNVESLEELDHYRWSGHSVLIGKGRNDWQERGYVLGQFGKGQREAIRAYRRFMEEGKNAGRRPELVGGGLIRSLGGWSKVLSLRARGEQEEYDARILGGGDFVHAILKEADENLVRQMKSRREKVYMDEVIRRMCKGAKVGEEELRGGGQRKEVSALRARIAHVLCREMGISMAEAARKLGVGTTAIAMAIRKKEQEKKN
jgi:REP element-mobilizing transposase RayT